MKAADALIIELDCVPLFAADGDGSRQVLKCAPAVRAVEDS
jgi:hypothetical protein